MIVGMPVTEVENAANNAVSGTLSTMLTGLVGTLDYLKTVHKKRK
jgi:hypothetical protein